MTMNNISTSGGLTYKEIELSRLKFQQSSANFKNKFHDKLKKKKSKYKLLPVITNYKKNQSFVNLNRE